MAEQATSAARGDDLREELARERAEVLRLRDLLIGRDAELGTLRGRLAELEEGSAQLITAAARMRARFGSPRAILATLRKLLRPQG